MGRLLRVGTKGVLGTGQDYGLLVDLQEVASAAVAALGAMEQRYGRFVVSAVDFYAQALDPFDFPDSRLGLASLADDLEEATDLLELESAPELAHHFLFHLGGLLSVLASSQHVRAATPEERQRQL